MNEWIINLLALVYGQAGACAIVLAAIYLLLIWAAVLGGRAQRQHARPWERRVLVFAAVMHGLLLASTVWIPHSSGAALLALGFAQALSLAACAGVILFGLEERWVALYALRPVVLAMPAAAVLLAAFSKPVPVLLGQVAALHVVCALVAHGVALLACGHALLLLSLHSTLKNGAVSLEFSWAGRMARHSPPLVVLERLLMRLSLWVAGLLSVTVGLGAWSGVLRFDHKTVLTVISLCVWLLVAWGYEYRTWRGRRVCVAVWGATALLLLAYIGSRFVLQTVLHRL
jgi:ABC-type uncharacterized transport system permease subunit